MDFEQYIIQGEPGRKERAENWQVAIGLQAVDGLKPSRYLLQTAQDHIEERISIDEVERRIAAYYQTEEGRREEAGTDEADGVSARIARLLAEDTFTLTAPFTATVLSVKSRTGAASLSVKLKPSAAPAASVSAPPCATVPDSETANVAPALTVTAPVPVLLPGFTATVAVSLIVHVPECVFPGWLTTNVPEPSTMAAPV